MHCWKSTAKWNMKEENFLEKRRTEFEENKGENFQHFLWGSSKVSFQVFPQTLHNSLWK